MTMRGTPMYAMNQPKLFYKRYRVMENNLGWFMAYMGIPLMVIFSLFFI